MSEKLDTSSAWAGALIAVAIPALLAGSALWSGFVLSELWNWFGVAPTGFRMTLPEAIGIGCIYTLFTHRFSRIPLPSDESPSGWVSFGRYMTSPILLLIGYAAHLYMGGR
jgi:hypothetical protein